MYTDGSSGQESSGQKCKWIGAYAYTIYNNDKLMYQSNANLIPAKISLCELMAVARALYTCIKLYPNQPIRVYTDSQYVISGSEHPSEVKTNRECWKVFSRIVGNRNIRFFHVKSHQGNSQNKHCRRNADVHRLAKEKLRSWFKK